MKLTQNLANEVPKNINVYYQSDIKCGTHFVWGSATQRIRVRPRRLLTKATAKEAEKGESRNYGNASH